MKTALHKYCILFLIILCASGIQLAVAQNQQLDSIRLERERTTDSIRAAQKLKKEQMEALRKYKASKRYKDSIEIVRQQRSDSVKAVRKAINDSIRNERIRVADSAKEVRFQYSDSIKKLNDSVRAERAIALAILKEERQQRADSLAARRAYRESKQYKDSVATIRLQRIDSARAVRKATTDSIKLVRQQERDSLAVIRKLQIDSLRAVMDSAKDVRMAILDSTKSARKIVSDSLTKAREERIALREAKAKEREEEKAKKKKLSLEIKLEKEREEYTNENMRGKAWVPPRSLMHNMRTRYNYHFNAKMKMEEAVENMLRTHTDNFESIIPLYPFDPNTDAAKLSNDMDTIIRKASLGIQIHDPRSKWHDNLYLLVGQAYYYKGDYDNAASAFKFIVAQAEEDKKKKERKQKRTNKSRKKEAKPIAFAEPEKRGLIGKVVHKSSKNDALLWLTRALVQDQQLDMAQTLLDMLRNDAGIPLSLAGRVALEQAFIDLKREDFNNAAEALEIVAQDKKQPKWTRQRAGYLAGQLFQKNKNYTKSNEMFEYAVRLYPPLEMDFNARKNIAFNSLDQSEVHPELIAMLEKMATDYKYKEYADQIYFILGNAFIKAENPQKALEHFKESVQISNNNPIQKGLSYKQLGDLYYRDLDYANAKESYDSAAALLTDLEEPDYSIAIKRAGALDKISIPGNAVKNADSLLLLASLTEPEQKKQIRDYIRQLERNIRDSIFVAMNAGSTTAATSGNINASPSAQRWYFSNSIMMQQGESEFKQKWGNRTLKDNWRRSTSSFDDANNFEEEEKSQEDLIVAMLPDAEELFAAIPNSEEEKMKVKEELKRNLFELGKGYFYDLEDYPNVIETFNQLDHRFAQHEFVDEVLYIRYIVAIRGSESEKALAYSRRLQSEFPNSEWTQRINLAIQQGLAKENLGEQSKSVAQHYDEAYKKLKESKFDEVLKDVAEAHISYPNPNPYTRNYELLKGIATAGKGEYLKADTLLSTFIDANPGDSLADWAGKVLQLIRSNPLYGITNSIENDTMVKSVFANTKVYDSVTLVYAFQPSTTHYVIFIAMRDAKFMGFRSGLTDYNLMKEKYENVAVSTNAIDNQMYMVVCRSFENAKAAQLYMTDIKQEKKLFRDYENDNQYHLISISEDNFGRFLVQKSVKEYMDFWKEHYR